MQGRSKSNFRFDSTLSNNTYLNVDVPRCVHKLGLKASKLMAFFSVFFFSCSTWLRIMLAKDKCALYDYIKRKEEINVQIYSTLEFMYNFSPRVMRILNYAPFIRIINSSFYNYHNGFAKKVPLTRGKRQVYRELFSHPLVNYYRYKNFASKIFFFMKIILWIKKPTHH